ncbi:hypothetical protein [Burkholderia lata]|uniref:hypothetical protein n=1 Tax=Burkholderia lata (strain ATCC 17760 / DSM 23089 / LMG 22485 / NCIMB 9086 / R18194 / 383) TaxID=482957 RepID=UPI001452C638|nr:hypothetical protein [Burkholderia lata]VWB81413.1 phage integrase [Burkholderia lata]
MNEAQFARVEEVDLDNRVWSIPGDRTKSGRQLRVPLCKRAGEIVRSALPNAKYGYVFPGCTEGRPLSNMAMLREPGHSSTASVLPVPSECATSTLGSPR